MRRALRALLFFVLLLLGGWLALPWLHVVPLHELLDAAFRVHQFLLAGKERMAFRADFHAHFRRRGARRKCVTAVAGNLYRFVFRMNTFSHGSKTPFTGKPGDVRPPGVSLLYRAFASGCKRVASGPQIVCRIRANRAQEINKWARGKVP